MLLGTLKSEILFKRNKLNLDKEIKIVLKKKRIFPEKKNNRTYLRILTTFDTLEN